MDLEKQIKILKDDSIDERTKALDSVLGKSAMGD